MVFRMLKKDMSKRKGIHIILFLFITLATVFLASSMNNIIIVSSGVTHYMNYANVPDINLILNSPKEIEEIDRWLEQQKKSGDVNTYDYNNLIVVTDKEIQVKKGQQKTVLDTNGASLYIGKMDVEFNKVYDEDGNPFVLKKGKIALSVNLMKQNHLKIGDKVILKIENQEIEFTIQEKAKDAAFGNEMVGMIRLIVSDEDYRLLEQDNQKLGLYYIMTDHVQELNQKINDQAYSTVMNTVTKSTYQMVYSFDMLMSALLILIGICLILIALLVLRFTLIFTMEEQYQEIGILKAIGFKNITIKNIYLLKYLVIVVAGSILGLLLSIPISNAMVASVNKNMIMESSQANFMINFACAIVVIILVLLFCYFCTRRLNRVSAITAIRDGETGERFGKQKGIPLFQQLHMPVSLYLGFNDIISHFRRYAVLIITFAISFVLITIPLNTLNTMSSAEMLRKFMLNPDSTINVRSIEKPTENKYMNVEDLKKGMNRIQMELEEKGYRDVHITASPIYFIKYSALEKKQNQNIMSIQLVGDKVHYAQYQEGTEPILENEIAFSKAIMKENNWKIGDRICANIGEKEVILYITGTYTDYMQLGKSARLNPIILLEDEVMFDYWNVMIDMDTEMKTEDILLTLKEQFPDYEWITGQQLVNQNIGGIQDVLADLLLPMTGMLCAIIMLITLLMEKLFIVREKGETAMLKSIGFRYQDIRSWQIIRMILVTLSSMIIAIPLSFLSNQYMLKPIFGFMGADVTIQVDPWNVYFIYPGILLLGIILATVFATRDIKKIDIREFNNLE